MCGTQSDQPARFLLAANLLLITHTLQGVRNSYQEKNVMNEWMKCASSRAPCVQYLAPCNTLRSQNQFASRKVYYPLRVILTATEKSAPVVCVSWCTTRRDRLVLSRMEPSVCVTRKLNSNLYAYTPPPQAYTPLSSPIPLQRSCTLAYTGGATKIPHD